MAMVSGGTGRGVNFNDLDIGGLLIYRFANTSPTQARYFDDGDNYVLFKGFGLTYNSRKEPTSGTVTSVRVVTEGDLALLLTDIEVAAITIFDYASANDTDGFFALVFSGADIFTGTPLRDVLRGYAGADSMTGAGGTDLLDGGAGKDTIWGGGGNDRITGGTGRDNLAGNAGSDVFDFNSMKDTGATRATGDRINDFRPGTDTIDLSTIDAIPGGNNDAFQFLGVAGGFSGPGQIRLQKDGANTLIHVNMTAESGPEMTIVLTGVAPADVTSGDFIL